MQVGHMQLFSRNCTPTLPIGSLREWIATGVPALFIGVSKWLALYWDHRCEHIRSLGPQNVIRMAMGRTGGDALSAKLYDRISNVFI
jgi:hypothetical protein